jgi:hypothetical protein
MIRAMLPGLAAAPAASLRVHELIGSGIGIHSPLLDERHQYRQPSAARDGDASSAGVTWRGHGAREGSTATNHGLSASKVTSSIASSRPLIPCRNGPGIDAGAVLFALPT